MDSTQRILPTYEIAKVPHHNCLAKVNRPGLSPFPRRQITPSSKLKVELWVADKDGQYKKMLTGHKFNRIIFIEKVYFFNLMSGDLYFQLSVAAEGWHMVLA